MRAWGPLVAAVGENPSALRARGPAAAEIAALWWLMLGLAAAVYAVTIVLLAVASRRAGRYTLRPGHGFVVVCGVAVPAVILVVLMVLTIRTGVATLATDDEPALTVQVEGRQFWWDVRYDDGAVVTANELHLPVGEQVEVELTSDDVVHSFWVPQLHGKLDMIPGRVNRLLLQADEPGVYRGICGEFCGIQHARMHFVVVAEPREQFDAWLEGQRAEAAEPAGDLAAEGREVFLGTSCVACHAIRGETGPNAIGPDLTHLASRRTIAAGMLANNRGNLAGWILDPQSQKQGARMPPTNLEGPQLQALLAYLESLE
ncbi:MAG: cytochrome c oxidase subunit II [Euzebyaceae bacterium]|nr:cytochrome c oxidase subunit II [Euzebyaceae bacterium]